MNSIRLRERGPVELRLPQSEAVRLIRQVCGTKVVPVWSPTAGAFLVARCYFDALARVLAEEAGTDDVCCVACHAARSSSTECACFCQGANHGSAS